MGEVKKVIVFGATGITGLALLRCAVQEKLEVTAYVRTPSKIPEELRKDITVIEGDTFDKEKVEKALEGQDAVLSALGPPNIFGDSQVLTQGVANIISGMEKHGIRKLCVVSVDERYIPGTWRYALIKSIMVITDHTRQRELLQQKTESIDWVAMMAPLIYNNMTVNPGYLVAKEKSPGRYIVNTGELADFMVKILNNEEKFQEYRHNFVGISSKKKWF